MSLPPFVNCPHLSARSGCHCPLAARRPPPPPLCRGGYGLAGTGLQLSPRRAHRKGSRETRNSRAAAATSLFSFTPSALPPPASPPRGISGVPRAATCRPGLAARRKIPRPAVVLLAVCCRWALPGPTCPGRPQRASTRGPARLLAARLLGCCCKVQAAVLVCWLAVAGLLHSRREFRGTDRGQSHRQERPDPRSTVARPKIISAFNCKRLNRSWPSKGTIRHLNEMLAPNTHAHHHHLRQLRAVLLRRGHPIPPPPVTHPDPDRAYLATIRAAASTPRLVLAACACLHRAGLPPPGPRALPVLLRSAARCEGAGVYVGGAHALAVRVGSLDDGFVGTALVGAYGACGCVGHARKVFDGMAVRDVVSWGVMLDSYCQTRNYKEALLLFAKMKNSGVLPDQLMLATVLSACGHIRHLRSGRAIHSYMLVSDILISAHLSSALINLYATCANMEMAEKLYNGMPRKDLVSSTAMVFGYARTRKVEIARSIFDGMPEKDVVSWSAMISGYADSNQPNEALSLFNDMQECGIRPDEVTMLSVISACASLGSLDKAKWIHAFIKNNGLNKILNIYNALIDMFAKCGGINLAFNIFNEMPQKNVITWTSMITAFAVHGDGKSALCLFEQMKNEGVEPNEVTFLNLLYACCHGGLVHEGRSLFSSMVQQYGIEPKHEHYGCMVDLLGRAKLMQEAVNLIESMHLEPNVPIWGSLLAACWMHGDLKLGAFAAKKILQLDPNHDGASVLLSKIYMKSDNLNDAQEVREVMKLHRVSKETGLSWMELNEPFHEFAAGGEKYSECDKIFLQKVVN